MPRYPLAGAGITKLSELEIDADKNWAVKAISRLAGLDASQVRGDIWTFDFEDHAYLIVKRLQAMEMGKILCSRGPGKPPLWAWGWEEPGLTSALAKFYPALIDLTYDTHIVAVDKSHQEPVSLATEHKQAYDDAPADYIKRLTPAVALSDSETAGITPDKTHNENAPITSSYDTSVV